MEKKALASPVFQKGCGSLRTKDLFQRNVWVWHCHLQPLQEPRDLVSRGARVPYSNGVVLVGQGQPVCNDHVHWVMVRLQSCCHLPNPAFQYPIHLLQSEKTPNNKKIIAMGKQSRPNISCEKHETKTTV